MKLVMLNELFYIKHGTKLDFNKMQISENSSINFISRTSKNLGCVCKVDRIKDVEPLPAGTITVSLGGSYLLSAFIQNEEYYTAQNIKILTPKCDMDFHIKLFYCVCISKNRYRYTSHGREANKTLDYILVPDITEIPNYIYNYKIELPNNEPILKDNNFIINTNFWNNFVYSDIFKKPTRGKLASIKDFSVGKIPVVTSTEDNNGISDYLDIPDFLLEEENTITIANNGSVGATFYQEKKYAATSDVSIMKLKDKNVKLNKYIALFLVTVISKEKYRFNYGRKWGITRMKKTAIKLPAKFINDKYEPDWEYMENYIKSLPYSSSI